MNSFKYESVSQEEFNLLLNKLRSSGMNITQWPNGASNSFLLDGHHIKATATYNPASLELDVTVTNKPFYVTLETIENGIGEFLNSKPTEVLEMGTQHEGTIS